MCVKTCRLIEGTWKSKWKSLSKATKSQVDGADAGRGGVFLRVLGFAGLFSGVALVAHIVSGVSLRLALALTVAVMVLSVGSLWQRASPSERTRLAKLVRVGMLSGILATIAYDAAKFALSLLDSSPYDRSRRFACLASCSPAGPRPRRFSKPPGPRFT